MKGQLKGFPPEVVEKMLEHQVAQGNPRDVSVFEKDVGACLGRGGFNWESTPEGTAFWGNVLGFPGLKHRFATNFDLFFNKYPKQMNKAETQAAIAALKEMVAQTTKKIEALEAQITPKRNVVTHYPTGGDHRLGINKVMTAYIHPVGGDKDQIITLYDNCDGYWTNVKGEKISGDLCWVPL